MSARDVAITGIGIVTSLGVGRAAHASMLSGAAAPDPVVDETGFAPYAIHPLPQIDWSEQIPRRGDQRQMDNWQRLGVFAAGLALDDAGLKGDGEACSRMDMIVAAGGGERDVAVDTLIVDEAGGREDREVMLNEKLTSELRPTLFLAQLSNLLAGNISIVHKVTGSSRTFMGEEGAGISAVETAVARIRAGQSTHALVGAAHIAERADMHFVFEASQALAQGGWRPLSDRHGQPGGGILLGSAGVFLVLESLERATGRGATIHALLSRVAGDRGPRGDGAFETRFAEMIEQTVGPAATGNGAPVDLAMAGASGEPGLSARERALLAAMLPHAPPRFLSGIFGHTLEAQFPLAIALAAIACGTDRPLAPFDEAEPVMANPPRNALVTTAGYVRGEGTARVSAPGAAA